MKTGLHVAMTMPGEHSWYSQEEEAMRLEAILGKTVSLTATGIQVRHLDINIHWLLLY